MAFSLRRQVMCVASAQFFHGLGRFLCSLGLGTGGGDSFLGLLLVSPCFCDGCSDGRVMLQLQLM